MSEAPLIVETLGPVTRLIMNRPAVLRRMKEVSRASAVQIHGRNGMTRSYLVEKLAREAIVCPIPEGTTQIQQLIIGRALTGVAAF